MSETDNPGIHIPPPIYVAAIIALALGITEFYPLALPYYPPMLWSGYLIVAVGIVNLLLCAWQFHRHETDIRPHKPASCMIMAGPYRYSRNPIYLSFLLLQLGYGLAIQQPWVILMLPISYLVLRYHVVANEEAYLKRKFGEDYEEYRAQVRRWL